jgi:hypothetical protein
MKNWFVAAGRFCVVFLLALVFLSSILALGHDAGSLRGGGLVLATLHQTGRLFPIAAVLAIFVGSYAFERRLKSRFFTWLSVSFLGFALLCGGEALSRLQLFSSPTIPEKLPAAGLIVESGNRALYVASYEKGRALGAIAYGEAMDGKRGLVYAEQAPYALRSGGGGAVLLAGRSFPASARVQGADTAALGGIPGIDASLLDARLDELGDLSPLLALAVLGGFALLSSGFSAFARLPRWPLTGFFLSALGFLALFFLDAAIADSSFVGLIRPIIGKIGLGPLPWAVVSASLEGLLGVLLALCFLLSRREVRS